MLKFLKSIAAGIVSVFSRRRRPKAVIVRRQPRPRCYWYGDPIPVKRCSIRRVGGEARAVFTLEY